MINNSYKIPANITRTEIIVKKSRFITTINMADSPEAAKDFVSMVRSEMNDANHHVYAFKIGFGNSIIEGMSDDGEPTGTSGPPTLAIIRGIDVGDIILVTTRYFGGTKLGTGGLVRAYTLSAQTAIQELRTILKVAKLRIKIHVPYHLLTIVDLIIVEYDGVIISKLYQETVKIEIELAENNLDPFINNITERTSGQINSNIINIL